MTSPQAQQHPTGRRRCRTTHQHGFALIAVIWSLGLITLLGSAAIVGARYRTRLTSSLDAVTATSVAAESAINLGIMTALTTKPGQPLNGSLSCRMPGGEQVTVTFEQEAGKVDLNSATPAVLTRLFTALTTDASAGERIARNILAFRESGGARTDANPSATQPGTGGAPNAKIGFTTITQLDLIDGMTPRLVRAALRLVTVRSGRPEPVAAAAAPALRAALNLQPAAATPGPDTQPAGDMTIRADAQGADGTRFVREALVSIGDSGRPYLIHEWRHGDIDAGEREPVARRSDGAETAERRCFAMRVAIAS